MRKIFKRLVAVLVVVTIVGTSNATLLAGQALTATQVTATPVWDLPQYRNHNRQYAPTNLALRNALISFYRSHAPHINNPFPWNWAVKELSDNDAKLSEEFISTVVQAFRNDTFAQSLPFNYCFVEILLNELDFYFAPMRHRWYWNGSDYDLYRSSYPYSGFFYHQDDFVFIGLIHGWTSQRGYSFTFADRFAATAIHELGHILGLGESLAHLFEEKFLGIDSATRPGNWERDTTFDRILLDLVGPEEFWRAAFTSNTVYGDLWNMHLGHIIDFNDLQLARTLVRAINNYNDIELNMYSDEMLHHLTEIPGIFAQIFDPNTRDSHREIFINHIKAVMDALSEYFRHYDVQRRLLLTVFDFRWDIISAIPKFVV